MTRKTRENTPPRSPSRRWSVEQAVQFLAESAKDAKLGGADGVDVQAEFRAHVRGGAAGDNDFVARLPGSGLELALHDFQGSSTELLPIFDLPAVGGLVFGRSQFFDRHRMPVG